MSRSKVSKKQKLAKRLVRWFMYNIIFALLPLAFAVLLRVLVNKLSINNFSSSPEILFFALTISATAMGDLSEIAAPLGWDTTLTFLGSALLLGAIVSSVLYGCLLYDSIIGPSVINFREGLLWVSIGLSAALFLLSTTVEILIGRIEGKS